LGPYEILAPIGAGGMGEVYRARDTRLAREVAIKVAAERFSERFEKEAHAIAALNHPNICTLHDVGPNYLVMELVEGPTLADRTAIGKVPLAETIAIARQIADALEAAHEKNIVHRDLKPANIKIKPDGTVKVLDFGLAKTAEPGGSGSNPENSPTLTLQDATRAGVILGTAGYMSPEQASGKPVDKRADIWAFGVVLWEMLTGKKMFAGETVSHTIAAVLIKEPDWQQLPADTPLSLKRLLKRCLERDLKRRLPEIGTARLEIDAAAEQESVPVVATRVSTRSQLVWVMATVSALLALSLGAVSFLYFHQRPSQPEVMRFDVPVPDKTGAIYPLSLSPDGRRLAIMAPANNGSPAHGALDRSVVLWIRSLDSPEPRQMPGTEGINGAPFWSPDGRFIVFSSGGKLKKIDASGGPPQPLCDISGAAFGGSWNREGIIIFGSDVGGGGIWRVPAAGGVTAALTVRSPQEVLHDQPVFLPDGRHFVYNRWSPTSPQKSGVYIGRVDAKPQEQSLQLLVASAAAATYAPGPAGGAGRLLFLREGTLMAQPFDAAKLELTGEAVPVAERVAVVRDLGIFAASATDILAYRAGGTGTGRANVQLTWFDREGKVVGTVGQPAAYSSLALSPDGARLAVARYSTPTSADTWLIDLARGAASTRFTFGQGVNGGAAWSPDGSRIGFLSTRNGGVDLYWKLANGAGQEELLLKEGSSDVSNDWSRDGRYLLYSRQAPGPRSKSGLWVLPVAGTAADRKPSPFLQAEFNVASGQFSPDSHWIAYASDASGRPEIYVQPFPASPAGGQWQVSTGGGTQPRWRRDGKELFYIAPDGKLMAAEVNSHAEFHAGIPRPLFDTRLVSSTATVGVADVFWWDVSPDGKKFLVEMTAEESTGNPITVVLNWTAGLK